MVGTEPLMHTGEEQVARVVGKIQRDVGERLGSVDDGQPYEPAAAYRLDDLLDRKLHAQVVNGGEEKAIAGSYG